MISLLRSPLKAKDDPKALPPIAVGDITVEVKIHPRARCLGIRYDAKKAKFILTSPKRASHKSRIAFAEECHDWMKKQLAIAPQVTLVRPGGFLPLEGKDRFIVHLEAPGVQIDLTDETLVVLCPASRFPRALHRYIQQRAQDVIVPLAHQKAAEIGKTIRAIYFRDTTTRWGSCTYDGKLSFSWRLILAPAEVIDYVVAHEVAHLQVFNHSEQFWDLCRKLTPHTTYGKHWLQQNGDALHRVHVISRENPIA